MNSKFKDIFKRNDALDAYVKAFEENYKQFCKRYTDDMEVESLRDLVPGLTIDDVKPDTEEVDYVINADPKTNP